MNKIAAPRRAALWAVACTLFAALGVTTAEGQPAAPPPPAPISGIIHVCSSCHGPGGHSISSTFPRLAGQQKDYIERQLKAFRDHTRADPHALTYMWGMAARLTDAQIAGIAAYYAAQPPVPGQPDNSPDVAAGRAIFTEGVSAQHVPACHTCHGAEGHGLSAFPRLAGQHRAYIERQLQAFASNQRANALMHENSKNLTAQQIREVAAYVRTLN
ncbi:MAG TPA: c-type cytochrome [Stellaceae bacterium]|nr:c-type cytochrome [Stellaceae bacterium]